MFGVVILAEFAARLLVSRHGCAILPTSRPGPTSLRLFHSWRRSPGKPADLRILRTLRLSRDYQMLARLREDSTFFRRNEEVIFAVTNLAVFIFVMTAIVYETQKFGNPQIANYADALYFTVRA